MLSWQYSLLIVCRNNLLHTGMSRVHLNQAAAQRPGMDCCAVFLLDLIDRIALLCYIGVKAPNMLSRSALDVLLLARFPGKVGS